MLSVVEDLSEFDDAVCPHLGYKIDQDPADFREALSDMGLADVFSEDRLDHWAKTYTLSAVMAKIHELLSDCVDLDAWETAFCFDIGFSDNEARALSAVIIDNLQDEKEGNEGAYISALRTRRRFRELAIGATSTAVLFGLYIAYLNRNSDKIPLWIRSLSSEELQQLETFRKEFDTVIPVASDFSGL